MERSKIKVIYYILFKPLTEPKHGNEWKGQNQVYSSGCDEALDFK